MRRIIYLALVWVFFACNEEEFITERGYPFLESISVSDLDETGVTINYEITKNGTSSISEYGVEFIESNKVSNGTNSSYSKVTESGAPSNSVINIRISYDLIDKQEYIARPYVKSGNTMVYGEKLVFQSRGVHPPVINSVSPTQFFIGTNIELTGEYFNSVLENNTIEVTNSSDYFVEIDSVFRDRIIFSIRANNSARPTEDQKLNLKLTSGGKSVIFPTEITSIVPTIIDINPSKFYVGDKTVVSFSYPIDFNNYEIYLENEQGDYTNLVFKKEVDSQTAEYSLYWGKSATYVPTLGSSWFPVSFPSRKIEILSSWEKYQSGLDFDYWVENKNYPIGDYLLSLGYFGSDTRHFKKMKLGESSGQKVPQSYSVETNRSYALEKSDGNKYFYYGLGAIGVEYAADFQRLNVETDEWEKLSDFPFDFTTLVNSFFFQGKLYAILTNYTNFRVFDPSTNQWTMSSVAVPTEVRGARSFLEVNGELVFLYNTFNKSEIYKYTIGADPVYFTKISQENYSVYNPELTYWDNNLIYMTTGAPIVRIDINTKEEKPIQFIFGNRFYYFIPWPTSEGFKLAFPISHNTYEMEPVIYSLVQDF